MSAKRRQRFFLDTNVFVYSFDDASPDKRDRARELIEEALERRQGVISPQVIGEFLNVATAKFEKPLTERECADYLDAVLEPLCEAPLSSALYREALDIRERWRLSFLDSLIVAAALAADCEVLFTEDLQHGQKIRDLTVQNPFRRED